MGSRQRQVASFLQSSGCIAREIFWSDLLAGRKKKSCNKVTCFPALSCMASLVLSYIYSTSDSESAERNKLGEN